jgi:hypothetical protein
MKITLMNLSFFTGAKSENGFAVVRVLGKDMNPCRCYEYA